MNNESKVLDGQTLFYLSSSVAHIVSTIFHLEEMVPRYSMHNDMFTMFKSLSTDYCVTVAKGLNKDCGIINSLHDS